jgi:prepilin-type N-terminal cleavage/methylation domain-containing protein
MPRKLCKKGFSLVELLVVITIIAILSVAAYVAVGGNTVKAKNSRRTSDIATIQTALEMYFAEKGAYPDTVVPSNPPFTGYTTFDPSELDVKYISKTPLDPWSTTTKPIPYAYGVSTNNKTYQLAATVEGDTTNSAYVVGNSTSPLIKDDTGADVTDGGANVPYAQPK